MTRSELEFVQKARARSRRLTEEGAEHLEQFRDADHQTEELFKTDTPRAT